MIGHNEEATTKENTYYIILYLGKDRRTVSKEADSVPNDDVTS